jgi:hypothetical protein
MARLRERGEMIRISILRAIASFFPIRRSAERDLTIAIHMFVGKENRNFTGEVPRRLRGSG